MIEPLESRVAPAKLNLAGTVLTYTDIDGDLVKVIFTKATMTEGDFTFSTGTANDGADTPRTLDAINFVGKTGAGFTLTATSHDGKGDSHANLKVIAGSGVDLGAVSVDGDVQQIFAGSGDPGTIGLKRFTALSVGRTGGYSSDILNAGTFTVKQSVVDSSLIFGGNVKIISIGGDFGDLKGTDSKIVINGNVDSLEIGGSVISALQFGTIDVTGATGTFSVGGSVIGGPAYVVGNGYQIELGSFATTISIGGDLRGSNGGGGGGLRVGSAGVVKIGGSIIGGNGPFPTGQLELGTSVKSISVGGDLRGDPAGTGSRAGTITAGVVGKVKIGGSMIGAPTAFDSGSFLAGSVGSFTLGHDLLSILQASNSNGRIELTGNLGALKIGGDIVVGDHGGSGAQSVIGVTGTIGSFIVGGSILGDDNHAALITAGGMSAAAGVAAIKSLNVKHSVQIARIVTGYGPDGTPQNAGAGIGSITIGGSLVGSQIMVGSTKGSDGEIGTADDGLVPGAARIDSLKIGGTLLGFPGDSTTYYVQAPLIKKAAIGEASYTGSRLHGFIGFNAIGKAGILTL